MDWRLGPYRTSPSKCGLVQTVLQPANYLEIVFVSKSECGLRTKLRKISTIFSTQPRPVIKAIPPWRRYIHQQRRPWGGPLQSAVARAAFGYAIQRIRLSACSRPQKYRDSLSGAEVDRRPLSANFRPSRIEDGWRAAPGRRRPCRRGRPCRRDVGWRLGLVAAI